MNKSKISMLFFDNIKSEPEPYSDIPLERCTIQQLKAKQKFLEKINIDLITECEALEMFIVKICPEFAETLTDSSWLPFDLEQKKIHVVQEAPKYIRKDFKQRMSIISDISGSMYHVVRRVHLTKLTTKHKTPVLKNVLDTMNMDYDKRYKALLKVSKKFNNIYEELEIQCSESVKAIENFKYVS
ncbi:uncharacterized protein LOC126898132 [Daktulosphaira vitifoliae]|uniref:uncharacterized protein LOC126898132 n=1 Tax=Daktulosphaira vitifoliae TaxID=58002 RepID=UPI0021AAF9B9|nr:uncharacterized protein LOC126898132 [Daktulosphaira vitifoliae]